MQNNGGEAGEARRVPSSQADLAESTGGVVLEPEDRATDNSKAEPAKSSDEVVLSVSDIERLVEARFAERQQEKRVATKRFVKRVAWVLAAVIVVATGWGITTLIVSNNERIAAEEAAAEAAALKLRKQQAAQEAAQQAAQEEEARKDNLIPVALLLCGLQDSPYATLGDGNRTLVLTSVGDDSPGLNGDEIGCVLGLLKVPQSVLAQINTTRALDGRQNAAWGDVEASWIYHPRNGLEMIVSVAD